VIPSTPNDHRPDDAFEARWASWKAAAAVQDQLWYRRATIVATAMAVAGTAVLGLAIYGR
jgi:hypothetical protein